MPRNKNFLAQPSSASATTDADFEMLFARHLDPAQATARTLPIDRIRPNPYQARRTFDDIEELARAIRAQGFTTRLRVRRDPAAPSFFQLVFGERRLRAAQEAGLTEVPCDIAEHTDDDLIEIGLAENIQRRDLDPVEEARAFRTFVEQRGYTQQRLAERIGKDRSYVEARLALLRTPDDVQRMVAQRPDTIRAAREIAKLPTPEARRPLIEGVAAGALTRDDVAALVREAVTQSVGHGALPPVEDVPAATPALTIPEQQRERSSGSQRMSAFDRALDRDIPALQATFSRWRQAAPTLTPAQRERVLAFIDEHVTGLEQLAEALRE